jgi:hypothetical protein
LGKYRAFQGGVEDEAFAKAEPRGRDEAGDAGGTFRWGGKPAEWFFAGVRKFMLCQDEDSRPGDGTEVSYLEMEVQSKAALGRLLNGQPVRVTLRDHFAEEEPANGAVAAGSKRTSSRT